ncbi:MAG: nicotinate (nicotinamide) nucleotide adenylyltransferase [Actinobacteria bacterium]|nr:nicotinate (nicotinamide) nucleotide adenylyltransferase [Actinomycetota bacterium]
MRHGILGGAFNPPHIGHMVLAQEALIRLGLDAVTLMPMGQAPHREIRDDPGAEVRVSLCEAAVGDDERLRVSTLETDREGPSYTVDTLRALRKKAPKDELFWILGGDQAAALRSWREPEEVLELCTVAVTERGAWRRAGVHVALSGLRGAQLIVYFDMPGIAVSSSLVRRRAARGEPIRYLVPEAVADVVEERGLYWVGEPAAASS